MIDAFSGKRIPHSTHPSVWNTNCKHAGHPETCPAFLLAFNRVTCHECVIVWTEPTPSDSSPTQVSSAPLAKRYTRRA